MTTMWDGLRVLILYEIKYWNETAALSHNYTISNCPHCVTKEFFDGHMTTWSQINWQGKILIKVVNVIQFNIKTHNHIVK